MSALYFVVSILPLRIQDGLSSHTGPVSAMYLFKREKALSFKHVHVKL